MTSTSPSTTSRYFTSDGGNSRLWVSEGDSNTHSGKYPRTGDPNRAVAIGRAGDPREAVAELSALRDHAEKVLGDTDPDVLKILSRLAWWEGSAKHRVRAILTLKARLELVVWRAKNGGTTTLVADLRQVVKAHQDRLGRHHADTLAAEFQLAYWLWETGDPQEARTLLTALQRRQGKYLKPGSRQITETENP